MAAPSTNLTHAECRARAAALTVASYRVELDLSRAADPAAATFPSRSTVTFTGTFTGGSTWIDLIADRVSAARIDGRELDVTGYDGARLAVPAADGPHELVVEAECRYSRTGEGLHRFVDPADGATYLYTHFEPTDARRVFANFEQPDLKARCTFVVTAPEGWQIVSGQAETARTAADGSVTVSFGPTPPQSTYLTALAAGPYHRVTDVWRDVPLGVLCRASMAEYLDAEAIFTVTRQGLDFYDRAFGTPTPGASTTRSSCPSTTSARWRTRAWSPSPRASSSAARRRARTGRVGPR